MTTAPPLIADWKEVELGDVCPPGGLVRGPFGGSLKKSDFVPTGFQVYEQRHAIWGPKTEARYFIDARKYKEMQRFAVEAGDFIVSCSGTIGRISRIPGSAAPGIINQALLKIRVDERVIDPLFFLTLFGWEMFQEKILDSTQGGAMQNLVGMPVFKATKLALPPMAEQQAIATAISSIGELITTLEHLIAKKQAIKQGMMQQLLTGRTRLPGFEKKWQLRKLGELLGYEQPGPYLVSSTDYSDTGVPVLTAGKTFVLGYTAEQKGIYENLPVIIFDDFTTASKFVDFPFKAKSSAMKMLKAYPGVNLRYIFERMQLIDFNPVDHKRRWIAEFSKFEVEVPETDEQSAIAGIIEAADAEIKALQRRLEKVRFIKQGMMQQLLTGRTRLPVEAVS
ncbi:restriction endonuclease subunit S [Leucobacter sp. cx-42]|uniref:restriction endonuclease subunit S n=1 Tax=unclassified Leucobacter TaxID=2621730 RepID=UPI00165D45D7|nr:MULTISPECIES: restriction endonuclease subunit S [unclassified Leucobacter]MBC9954733.1 restriction endonuclease subunit S [Leucobacter sp. cx-42]